MKTKPPLDVIAIRGPRPLPREGQLPQLYTYADGRTCAHPDGEMHDCRYVNARNRLIPRATRIAWDVTRGEPDPNGMRFSRAFAQAMTELYDAEQASQGSQP